MKPGKAAPAGFVEVQHDDTTGKTVGWEPIEQSPFVKFWREAVKPLVLFGGLIDVGCRPIPGTYELIGPKINGNPERAETHRLESHDRAEVWDLGHDATPLDYMTACRAGGVEGIVWHHPDGRMAKLKVRDIDWSPVRPLQSGPSRAVVEGVSTSPLPLEETP